MKLYVFGNMCKKKADEWQIAVLTATTRLRVAEATRTRLARVPVHGELALTKHVGGVERLPGGCLNELQGEVKCW